MTEARVESVDAVLGFWRARLISFSAFRYHKSAVGSNAFEFGRVPNAARVTAEKASTRA